MTLPQTNAVLERVQSASSGDSAFDTGDEGAGAERWAGQVDAYLQEKRDRVVTAEGVTRVQVTSLIVANSDLPADLELAVGDVVTFTRDGASSSSSASVAVVERRAAREVPAHVQTTRITLEAVGTA